MVKIRVSLIYEDELTDRQYKRFLAHHHNDENELMTTYVQGCEDNFPLEINHNCYLTKTKIEIEEDDK